MSELRLRSWAFIGWKESLPADWIEKLKGRHIPFVVSPLHDKDRNEQGELKKPHYHIVLLFDGKKSCSQIEEITHSLNQGLPIPLDHVGGYIRYLVHLDDKDKAQYEICDIQTFCGADIAQYFMPGYTRTNELLDQIEDYILSNRISEFEDLIRYAKVCEPQTWMPLLRNGYNLYLNNIIKSVRHRPPVSNLDLDEGSLPLPPAKRIKKSVSDIEDIPDFDPSDSLSRLPVDVVDSLTGEGHTE